MPKDHVTVGRIVHYVAFGTPGGEYEAGAHRAAVVTQVLAGAVSLMVINPTGIHFRDTVTYNEDHQPGTWHWPEREGDLPPRPRPAEDK